MDRRVDRFGTGVAPFTGMGGLPVRASLPARGPAVVPDRLELGASDPDAVRLSAAVIAAWRALPAMEATSEVVAERDGKPLRRQTIHAAWQAPARCRLDVVAGDSAGSHIEWDGGALARVSKACFRFDWPLDHPRLVNPHGWTLRDTAPGMVVRVLADPRTRVRSLGREGALETIEVRSPASPAGVTREELAIDPVRALIVERRLYAGDALLGRVTVKRFTPGSSASEP